ncbi:MAG: 2Fe-2S iron-sulfur cluster-binding protein, partial [Eubacterium sp.]
NLLEAARKAGIMIDTPCSGNGTCGKCKVRIAEGKVDTNVFTRLTEKEIAEGWVLACCAEIVEDIQVEVPDLASAFQNQMQITDLSENERKNIRYVRNKMLKLGMTDSDRLVCEIFELPEPTNDDNLADEDRLRRYFKQNLGYEDIEVSLNVLRKFPDAFRGNDFQVEVVYLKCDGVAEIMDIRAAGSQARVLYGVALD